MPNTISSVDNLFEAPDFSEALKVWQSAEQIADEARATFEAIVRADYESDDSLSKGEVEDQVDHALEMGDEMFELFYGDEQEKVEARTNIGAAEQKATEAIAAVTEAGQAHGASQFALYGLRLYMAGSEIREKALLKEKIEIVENDFGKVDAFIRNHPGEVLTVTDVLGIYAGRLGIGGLSITDKGEMIIPQAEGGNVYAMSYQRDMPNLYVCEKFGVRPSAIHSILGSENAETHDNWASLLDMRDSFNLIRSVFAVGEPAAGPPRLPDTNKPSDRDYLHLAYERVCKVATAAANE